MARRNLSPDATQRANESLYESWLIIRYVRTADLVILTQIFVLYPGIHVDLTGLTKQPAAQKMAIFGTRDGLTEIDQAGQARGRHENILFAFQIGVRDTG